MERQTLITLVYGARKTLHGENQIEGSIGIKVYTGTLLMRIVSDEEWFK